MEASGKRYIWHRSRSDTIEVWNFSDIHLLNKACAETDLRRDIDRVASNPNAFWLGGGDYCDFVGYTDKRFDPDSVAPWVKISALGDLGMYGMTRIRDLFLPIKDRCLGLLEGNHEKLYTLRNHHESLHAWLCTELGVPSLGYCCLFDLVFYRTTRAGPVPGLHDTAAPRGAHGESFRVFAHHGAGYAQTPGGKLNRLIQFMQSFEADIYFCGHVHDQVGRREPSIGANASCTRLVAHERLGVISGSYLKTYAQGATTYGEQRGYRPVALGAAHVTIEPETRRITGEI